MVSVCSKRELACCEGDGWQVLPTPRLSYPSSTALMFERTVFRESSDARASVGNVSGILAGLGFSSSASSSSSAVTISLLTSLCSILIFNNAWCRSRERGIWLSVVL
ncbi:hypothetical protein BDZ45DRAFT_458911 [Acephala macrosclerotiorum]|nr:hypothetical protein BDZ45DRAFT_458911 [Acephala macrosclerotiorum]